MTDGPTGPPDGGGARAGQGAAAASASAAGDEGAAPRTGGVASCQASVAAPISDEHSSWSARRQLLLLLLGIGAVVLASMAGGTDALGRILEPPFPVGLLLAVAAVLLGIVVVLRAASRIGAAHEDARELIRAVRLIFLAVGCFAAAAGWVIGSAVPIVAGLMIVGIDVIETTFLLLVTAAPGTDPGTPSAPG